MKPGSRVTDLNRLYAQRRQPAAKMKLVYAKEVVSVDRKGQHGPDMKDSTYALDTMTVNQL